MCNGNIEEVNALLDERQIEAMLLAADPVIGGDVDTRQRGHVVDLGIPPMIGLMMYYLQDDWAVVDMARLGEVPIHEGALTFVRVKEMQTDPKTMRRTGLVVVFASSDLGQTREVPIGDLMPYKGGDSKNKRKTAWEVSHEAGVESKG